MEIVYRKILKLTKAKILITNILRESLNVNEETR